MVYNKHDLESRMERILLYLAAEIDIESNIEISPYVIIHSYRGET